MTLHSFKNNRQLQLAILASIGAILIFGGSAIAAKNSNSAGQQNNSHGKMRNSSYATNPTIPSINSTIQSTAVTTSPETVVKDLTYMIEEEKLAHDVYQVLYEKWGSRVFSNISKSELNHQEQLLAVLMSRNIDDPRSSQVGVFQNQDLQALYNKLIAQGSQSVSEAYKVGVAIEELDIADLQKAIAELGSSDSDIANAYQSLLGGSQRHLRAFNRQL